VTPSASFDFRCPLGNGLHARPASRLVEAVSAFRSEVRLANGRTGESASARSVIALVALDLRQGDLCTAHLSGPDAPAAGARLRAFVETELPSCDAPLPKAEARPGDGTLPRALRGEAVTAFPGTCASRGVGEGRIVHARGGLRDPGLPRQAPTEEQGRVDAAFAALRRDLEARIAANPTATEAAILGAHLAIARDEVLAGEIAALVGEGHAAGRAIAEVCERHCRRLRAAGSAWIRERALDLEDIGAQLLEALGGEAPRVELAGPSVVVAETMTPRQLLSLERRHVAALAIGNAGTTSHTIILARSFGIPALTGVRGLRTLPGGSMAIVDADHGVLLPDPNATVRRHYRRAARWAGPAAPAHGKLPVAIHANVSTAQEVEAAIAAGAGGIGLFRTEMLFMDRAAPPTEEEQYAVYARAAATAQGRPVVIRTLDAGGDKPVPYLDLPREPNPFLGLRGVRLYARHRELIATQLRAIRRAAAHGALRVLVPMVATVEEIRRFKSDFAWDHALPLGAMIEVPSAAFQVPELAAEVDFFSIGSNDLLQYFMAADRGNPEVAGLYTPLHPPFLALLGKIVGDAHRAGRKVCLCGEMARDPACLAALVGLGLDELSMAIPDIAPTRAALARPGLADPSLVRLDSDSGSRAEVIAELVAALRTAGRTREPRAVEEAIWAREEVASTAVGHGFAIPHCKCDALSAPSIAVARLAAPVAWGDEDVTCIILLALRESDGGPSHLKVLSRLARRLMHEEFRAGLLRARDPEKAVALLSSAIEERQSP